jgi:hypothetical protein
MTNTYVQINGQTYDASMSPSNRKFRDAWVVSADQKAIEVDMNVAREIQKDRVRAERSGRFPSLDAQFMKALEVDDANKRTEIAALKEKLRNAPDSALFDNATTPEQLEAITLDVILAE